MFMFIVFWGRARTQTRERTMTLLVTSSMGCSDVDVTQGSLQCFPLATESETSKRPTSVGFSFKLLHIYIKLPTQPVTWPRTPSSRFRSVSVTPRAGFIATFSLAPWVCGGCGYGPRLASSSARDVLHRSLLSPPPPSIPDMPSPSAKNILKI